jgi:glycosyltransferase involved in cell wall biosynthesis
MCCRYDFEIEPMPPTTSPKSLMTGIYAVGHVGGVETWSLRMLHEGQKRGLRTATVLMHEPNTANFSAQEIPEEVARLDLQVFSWRGFRESLARVPLDLMPACVVPNYSLELYALCASWSAEPHNLDIRTIGMCHTDDQWLYWLLSHYEPIIHRFVAVSNECARHLAHVIPHRKADIVTRAYGIDMPPQVERGYSRAPQPLQLLYAGRMIEHQKRISDLLRLSVILVDRGIDFHLRVVGEGPNKANFVKRLEQLSPAVHSRISVEPSIEHRAMPALLQSADVAVLVSAFEGTSLFMLEAMANGTIPVVTDVSGAPELVHTGITGYRVPVGDLKSMADAVCILANDRAKLAEMGQAARRQVKDYTQEAYNEWFFGLLDEVWDEPPRRWPKGRRFLPFAREFPSRLFDYFPGWYTHLKNLREFIMDRFGI